LNKEVQEAAIITPNGTSSVTVSDKTKMVWINQAPGSLNQYIGDVALNLDTTPSNITLIQANPDPAAATRENYFCTKMRYIHLCIYQ
jgi:hypothetical protein